MFDLKLSKKYFLIKSRQTNSQGLLRNNIAFLLMKNEEEKEITCFCLNDTKTKN